VGITFLEVEVANVAAPEAAERLTFLVDSGAIYSVVPAAVLQRLGIRPFAEHTFRLADGSTVVRKKGGALFRYRARMGVADVIFGEEGDATLLGVTALEALGLSFDPIRRELRELPLVLAVQAFHPEGR
jgi:clan AA aspartic protease